MNPDDRAALMRKTLSLGIKIVEEERRIMVGSYREIDGKVRDVHAKREIRLYFRGMSG